MANRNHLPVEDILYSAARSVEPTPTFADTLWTQISGQPKPVRQSVSPARVFKQSAWVAAIVIVTITIGVAFVGPQKVLAAFQGIFGYLPGIGFVQNDAKTLYLAHPIVRQQDGITLTIDQAVSDANGTVVAYHIDGLPVACFYDQNSLRFPDGRARLPIGGGVEGHQARVEFPSLPAGVMQATLLVSMNPNPDCSAPTEWTVELDFGPVPPNLTLLPVVEAQTTQLPAITTNAAEVTSPVAATAPVDTMSVTQPDNQGGIWFVIDRAAVLPDGYLVTGHIEWGDSPWESAWLNLDNSIQATDASGKAVMIDFSDASTQNNTFTFKIVGKEFQRPLTLKFVSVSAHANPSGSPSFTVDTGIEPKVGQTWTFNQHLEFFGHEYTVRSISAVQDEQMGGKPGAPNGYAFEIHSATRIDHLFVGLTGLPSQTVEGKFWSAEDGTMIFEQFYPEGLPTGKLTFHVAGIVFHLTGPWQIEWQPPDDF